MKKQILIAPATLLVVGHAFAADLPPPPGPPPTAPATYVPGPPVLPYNWSGIYLGINGGYGFSNNGWNDAAGGSASFTGQGFLGGGTIGGNYQVGTFVFGVEGDGDWTNLKGNLVGCGAVGAPVIATNPNLNCQSQSDWLATARGRVGYAFDRILLYGTGGAAFGDLQAGLNGTGALPGTIGTPTTQAAPHGIGGGVTTNFNSTTQIGWTAGAGIEGAIAPNWTIKLEYLFVDLGTANGLCTTACNFTGAAGATKTPFIGTSFTENIVRAGINYKFNWW